MRNVYSQRPAENTVFRERFTNPSMAHRNGAVLTGGPTIKNGVGLDGATQHVTYSVPASVFSSPEISLVLEFTPQFATDYDVNLVMYDSSVGKRYTAAKLDNGAGNTLFIILGGISISIPEATYSPFWLQGKKNVLVVSGTNGATNAWLNGAQVLTGAAAVWSPKDPAELYIGVSYIPSGWFLGTIHSLSIYSRLYTAADVAALDGGGLFSYRNKATVWYDLAESTERRDSVEILADYDMEAAGVGDWTAGNSATLTKETTSPYAGNQVLRVTRNGVDDPYASQAITPARKFQASGWARSDGNALPVARIGSLTINWTGTTSTDWQYFNIVGPASDAAFALGAITSTGTEYVEFDQVELREVHDQTLDKSPNGRVLRLGDGLGTGAPDFVDPGFEFNGIDEYLIIPDATGIYNNAEQTIVIVFRPNFAADDDVSIVLLDSSNSSRYSIWKAPLATFNNALEFSLGQDSRIIIPIATYLPHWRAGAKNVLVITGVSGNNDAWLNGRKVLEGDTEIWTAKDPAELFLGTWYDANNFFFDGRLFHLSAYPFRMGDLQARDLTLALGVSV